MNLEQLKKYVIANGGATLTKDAEIASFNAGFMVSLPGFETISTLEDFNEKTFKAYCRIARKKKAYFGLWMDDGKIYLDVSIKINDKATARKIGKKNNQLAIYDLEKQESIYLN